jgi:hypothetical protein
MAPSDIDRYGVPITRPTLAQQSAHRPVILEDEQSPQLRAVVELPNTQFIILLRSTYNVLPILEHWTLPLGIL